MTTATVSTRASFASLAYPGFRWFTVAGMLWMMADNIEHVISYWMLYQEFASPMLGGYAVISHWAPFLLAGMYMGALADRYDCRKLFIVSMAMFMAVSLAWAYLFFTGTTAIWHAVVLLTIHGLAGAVFAPASQLILHDLVGDKHIPSAVRLTATSRQVGLMLGPAVGGFLLLSLGPAWGLLVNACIYLPMVWWSLSQPYTGHGDIDLRSIQRKPVRGGLSTAIDTIKETSHNPTIISMIVLVGLTSLLVGGAYQPQMPEFAKSFVGADTGIVYTVLLLASAVGAIFGGLLQESLPYLFPSPRKATIIAGGWAAAALVFAVAPNYQIAVLSQFVSGMMLISFTAMAQALVQLEAPPESRGRIIGLFNTSLNGLRIGSGFTVGFLGAAIGIHWSLGLSAAVLLLTLAPLLWYVNARPALSRAG